MHNLMGCFKVISMSRIIGPALVLRDPRDHAHPASAEIERYHVSDYHTLGSRYHGFRNDIVIKVKCRCCN